jgi:hypothetical protein
MQYKTTKRLFNGKYQYKVVLVSAVAQAFRSKDLAVILKNLQKVQIDPIRKDGYTSWRGTFVRSQDDIDYAFKLHNMLSSLAGITVRVETPWVSVYTNERSHVDALIKLDSSKVKYACLPPDTAVLEHGVVIMSKVEFDYKVTLSKTNQECSAFVQWAENNPKLKLTKSCKKELSKHKSWGGTFFYITGENNLLMAKMHLGGSINKIERIIKA